MDWTCITANEPVEEEGMSRLAAGFTARMRKRAAGSKGEAIPIYDGKRSKRSSPDEQAREDWVII